MTPPSIRRVLACLFYEVLVIFSLLMVGFWIPQTLLASLGINVNARLLIVHIFVLLLVYFCWFWLHGGQTLAMKTWRLRLVNADGMPLRPLQAVLRYMAAWILPGFFLAFGPQRRALHDLIAGTRLVVLAKSNTDSAR